MKLKSAIPYYISSVVTLLKEIRNRHMIPFLLFKKPVRIMLHNGMRFDLFSFADLWTLKEVAIDKCYEQYRGIGKNWIIVDMGAGFGDFSIMNSFKSKKIVSCEINPQTVQRLRNNIAINRAPNIEIAPVGAHKLQELFQTYKINSCDLLKIDCEGCEYPLLFTASSDVLKKVRTIVMEYHTFDESMRKQFTKMIALLKKEHFTVTYQENPVHTTFGILFATRK
ncbi:MAG: FkbM family methyltransferase [Patescibacteria group bacterium]|jgi:precorrin-6B methylase 2